MLYVQGTWVYDTLHEGWNGIHSIKIAMKVGGWKGDWADFACEDENTTTPPDIILRVRKGFQVAQATETIANQSRPEHQWQLHLDLDGCAREVIL